jgi:hypothetical protein
MRTGSIPDHERQQRVSSAKPLIKSRNDDRQEEREAREAPDELLAPLLFGRRSFFAT